MATQEQISKTIDTLKEFQKGVRKTTLNRQAKEYTPYQTLISCLLSLQSKDETTEKICDVLFKIAKTPEEILKLEQERLENIIYSSGYYKNKAKTIKHVSEIILKEYKNKVPDNEQELLKIKGIGRKTANIVLSLAYGKEALPIDTHCHRIPNRLGWIKTKNPEQSEIELMKILPKKYWPEFNGIFVLFGKTICVPISPLCSKCPVAKYCKKINVKSSR